MHLVMVSVKTATKQGHEHAAVQHKQIQDHPVPEVTLIKNLAVSTRVIISIRDIFIL